MNIPSEFGIEFLEWFRQRSEKYWSQHEPRKLANYVAAETGGFDWQRGTHWLTGLADDLITGLENEWLLAFPPDYRLFLRRLHCVDRPLVGALFSGSNGSKLERAEKPSFCNWLTEKATIQERIEWPRKGIEFDLEHNNLWLDSWGDKPINLQERKQRLRQLISQAPKLIPLFGHRYLLVDSTATGNPILSIYQSDIIVYATDLHSYLLDELSLELGISRYEIKLTPSPDTFESVPFWGAFLG